MIFGTIYNISYQHHTNLQPQIDSLLKHFDGSLSMFNDSSIISRINRNEPITVDSLFANVFNRSSQISIDTDGAFDITVAPLVNAWGFGFKEGIFPDSSMVDSLMNIIGYDKVYIANNKIIKTNPALMLDCSAIAKGYAVDIVAQFLAKNGISNYLVDIGGEVMLSGVNNEGNLWRIGINRPIDDSTSTNNELQFIIQLSDCGIATSGNYRNFYYRAGKQYSHTSNPSTGYPTMNSILSATVIADDCMTADAYATAFMVMGLDSATLFLNTHPNIDACFIYTNQKGEMDLLISNGFKKYIIN